ncbi:MAG: YqiA/YcfP family alpha/beta fold hydrolase [Myxococcota bacterium]
MTHYAHLHGFASSPNSRKGTHLSEALRAHGAILERLNLNRPSFAQLTYTGALEAMDEADARAPAGTQWCLSGSSMGGWVAARWAELNPDKVERLVLLCPGFNLVERWPALIGTKGWADWEAIGAFPFQAPDGHQVSVWWEFIIDAKTHPPVPEVPCSTLIIHGTQDDVVPIEGSRRYAQTRPHVTLVEVNSDHGLISELPKITTLALSFFGFT